MACVWSPRLLHSLWKPKEIYIIENGCAPSVVVSADGNVYGSSYVPPKRYDAATAATEEGIPLKGNFVWSAMDNFEWADGYETLFGIVYVDFKTQKRIPKLSAQWFRQAARRNALV